MKNKREEEEEEEAILYHHTQQSPRKKEGGKVRRKRPGRPRDCCGPGLAAQEGAEGKAVEPRLA
ncbi:hypothetical protein CCMA1212_009612 [Trichoderma ghanense]|uniref:Uncharacterized protein n=1 Tax=Trichoderma ghanense TaxID=65468 RepID=A0ABY2GU06_9HYPO